MSGASTSHSLNHWVIAGKLVAFLVLASIVVYIVSNGYTSANQRAKRNWSRNNLKYIGIAARNFHEKYGRLPSNSSAGKVGEPSHSWRVEIAPYLESNELAAVADLYQKRMPWNHPGNQKVSDLVVERYRHPFQPGPREATTNYLAVIGDGFVMNDNTSVRMCDVVDGAAETIFCVEYYPCSVPWAQPMDLTLDEYASYVADKKNLPPRGGSFLVSLVDGTVRSLPPGIPMDQLRALFTYNGGEAIDPKIFDQ